MLAEEEPDVDYCKKLAESEWLVAKELKCTTGGGDEQERRRIARHECFRDNAGRRSIRKLKKKMKKQTQDMEQTERESGDMRRSKN